MGLEKADQKGKNPLLSHHHNTAAMATPWTVTLAPSCSAVAQARQSLTSQPFFPLLSFLEGIHSLTNT